MFTLNAKQTLGLYESLTFFMQIYNAHFLEKGTVESSQDDFRSQKCKNNVEQVHIPSKPFARNWTQKETCSQHHTANYNSMNNVCA